MDAHPDILVVDDDPDLREVVRIMLHLSGYEVRCARNGREALLAVEQKVPAVVLLDMRMPVMNGWECARELRVRYGRSLPIVVVTAAEHARASVQDIGDVDEVLSKPFDMDALLEVVARFAPEAGLGLAS